MIQIKLREQGKPDYYTSAYPHTTIQELKMTCFPMQWSRGDSITVCFFVFFFIHIHNFITIIL